MSTVLYLRQSLARAGDELAIDRQRSECQKLCERRGWDVSDTLVDNNVSASKRGRPAYTRLTELMESRTIERVVILRIDRLMRLNDELEELIKLTEGTGVQVATVEGDIDLSTPQGRLVARVLVSVARAEMETKSARHKLANRQKAMSGKPHGSRRPFGYNDDQMTLNESEAAVLRGMAERLLAGSSFKEIAWHLNEQGIKTTLGKLWYPVTVRNMIQKPRYGGIRTYKGEVVGRGTWEPVFDEVTWERLQATMRHRREGFSDRPRARKYLLTGFLYCGSCGSTLNGETKRDAPHKELRPVYTCRSQGDEKRAGGCGGVTRNAAALDHFIREVICYRLDTPDLSKLLTSDKQDLSPLLNERETLKTKLDSLTDDYADGTLTKSAYKRASERVTASLRRVEAEIESLHRSQFNVSLKAGQTVKGAWMSNSDGWRRELIGMLVEKIVVSPGRTKPFYDVDGIRMRFDPELVSVGWRV